MTAFDAFAGAAGAWTGTNGFRLLPDDPVVRGAANAELTLPAAGHLLAFAYGWEHPEDGGQEGLLVVGAGEDGALTAIWGDSWHQKPEPLPMTGAIEAPGRLRVSGCYAGDWGWGIAFAAAGGESLTVTMENVVPASAATAEVTAGAYTVMLAELRRPAGWSA